MTQNTKKTLMYGGAIVVVSAIAYAIYSAKKNKLPLVDGARVYGNEDTTAPKETKLNPFSGMVKNLPSSIGYTFGSTTNSNLVNNALPTSIGYTFGSSANLK
jgi:hypothetical protein